MPLMSNKRPRLDHDSDAHEEGVAPAEEVAAEPSAQQQMVCLEATDMTKGKGPTEFPNGLRRLFIKSPGDIHDAEVRSWRGLEELKHLHVLDLANVTLDIVPREVAALTELKALMLVNCGLRQLEHLRGKTKLNSLVVNRNRLTALPEILTTLTNLSRVSASHNLLTAAHLPDLSSLPLLRQVRLPQNQTLEGLPPHFATWGRGHLTHIVLSSTGIATDAALEPLFGHAGSLVELNLKGTPLLAASGDDVYEARMREAIPKLRIYNGDRIDDRYLERKVKLSRKELKQQKREAREAEAERLVATAEAKPATTVDEDRAARQSRRKEEHRTVRAAAATAAEPDADFDHVADFVSLDGDAPSDRNDREAKKQRMLAKKAQRKADRQAAAQAVTDAHPLTAPLVAVAGKRKAEIVEAAPKGAGWIVDSAPANGAPPKKKRKRAMASEVPRNAAGKGPRSIGGSLSAPAAPTSPIADEPAPTTAEDDEKKRTAVAAIVKVSKRKPRKEDLAAVDALLRGEGAGLAGEASALGTEQWTSAVGVGQW